MVHCKLWTVRAGLGKVLETCGGISGGGSGLAEVRRGGFHWVWGE